MKVINPHVRVIGLTATPFRLKGGLICKPENILNEICYEAGLKEMIQQGYLSPLISRAGRAEANLANLHIRGGEFISDEVAAAMDNDALVTSACREIVELTRDRKSVLIFTASVDHCKHVAEKIQAFSGKECAIVTGDTSPAERAEIIARFKGEFIPADLFGTPKPPLKFLANVNVLTTGFDAPNTDCVVMYYRLRCAEHGLRCDAPPDEFAGVADSVRRTRDAAVTRHRQGQLYCGGDNDTHRQRSCPHRKGHNANEALGRYRICAPRRNSIQGRAKCH